MARPAIRPFVPGADDATWVELGNAARAGMPDFVPATIEEFRIEQQSPGWNPEELFIAEFDRSPVALVGAYVDPKRAEPLGFLGGPSVLPGYRRQGIGTVLVKVAIENLAGRGMERVVAWAGDWNQAGKAFLAKLGFEPVRRFSLMRRPLADLPPGNGEELELAIDPVGTSVEESALVTRLANAAFREHFLHREGTEEESVFWTRNEDALGLVVRRMVARLAGEPVGFLVSGHVPRENEQLGVKRGGLWSLGVLKKYRNRGIGRRLMLNGMHWLAAQGLDEVELGVDDANVTRARTLYEKLGFATVRVSTVFERPLLPGR